MLNVRNMEESYRFWTKIIGMKRMRMLQLGTDMRPGALPRQTWESDIEAGLNCLEMLPTEGPQAPVDDLENAPRFGEAEPDSAVAPCLLKT